MFDSCVGDNVRMHIHMHVHVLVHLGVDLGVRVHVRVRMFVNKLLPGERKSSLNQTSLPC